MAAALLAGFAAAAPAQTIEVRQWQGAKAAARQPEQVVASTNAEWRSLWSRVGVRPPDFFEPGRTSAVGIFLGLRNGDGYSVNVLSTSRRRDRIMVVFEERVPSAALTAQRAVPRPASNAPALGAGGSTLPTCPSPSSNGSCGNFCRERATPVARSSVQRYDARLESRAPSTQCECLGTPLVWAIF
ncbi:MAG: hypothetical protein NTV97_11700 [Alphaproteobacteria bacterium]|nr:hypothetical protein [Alphaproteobacteria bacterium]